MIINPNVSVRPIQRAYFIYLATTVNIIKNTASSDLFNPTPLA